MSKMGKDPFAWMAPNQEKNTQETVNPETQENGFAEKQEILFNDKPRKEENKLLIIPNNPETHLLDKTGLNENQGNPGIQKDGNQENEDNQKSNNNSKNSNPETQESVKTEKKKVTYEIPKVYAQKLKAAAALKDMDLYELVTEIFGEWLEREGL